MKPGFAKAQPKSPTILETITKSAVGVSHESVFPPL
jgi:hypothetical protein